MAEKEKDQNYLDYSSLFDLSTVSIDSSLSLRPYSPIKSHLIPFHSLKLTENSYEIIQENLIELYEEDEEDEQNSHHSNNPHVKVIPKRLNLSRGCGRDKNDTDHYVIPSLRLNYIETKEYYEPIRDREKDWILDSQREILNNDPNKEIEKKKLKLGEHKKLNQFPPLVWCQPLQTSLRKRSLFRMAAVISDTHCFVNIYGLGVAGRITAPGGNTNRMLMIEAYSVWNSTIYTLPIHIPQLKRLFCGREELLIPGRKKELLKALIPLLYFDYTVVYTIPSDDPPSPPSLSALTQRDDQITATITEDSIPLQPETIDHPDDDEEERGSERDDIREQDISSETAQNEIEKPREKERDDDRSLSSLSKVSSIPIQKVSPAVQKSLSLPPSVYLSIHHLNKFSLPPGYPQSIAEIIRAMSSSSSHSDGETTGDETFIPNQLIQTLHIGPEIRENGPVVRRRDIEEKIRLEKIEEDRKRKIWQDTPRRYKGLMSVFCLRRYGKFVVMSSYRMPLKPTVMSIKGHVAEECTNLSHFLDLGSLGQSYKITLTPRKWDDSLAKMICKKTTKLLSLGESVRSTLYLKYQTKTGSEIQLLYPKSCKNFEMRRSVTKERNLRLPSRWLSVPDDRLDQSEAYFSSSNSSLGKASQRKKRLYAGDPVCGSCQPLRDIGRPKRLVTRGKKIGHAYGIYTLYLTGKLSTEPLISIKEMEECIEMKSFGNEVLPESLGPTIELMMEIYFPENPTYLARQKGEQYNFGSEVMNGPTVLRFILQRGDLCRLIEDKYYLRTGFRVSHTEFYEFASMEDVTLVENVWKEIGDQLLKQCRWRRTLQGMTIGNGKGYYAKLTTATGLMCMESVDVTKEVLGQRKIPTKSNTKKSRALVSKESDLLCDSKAELVLVLSTVLHIQNCQVNSIVENRQNVSLQVIVWQRGMNLGLICFDWYQRDIYFVQPSQPEQDTLCIPFQAAGREEITINLSLYVTGLTYDEEKSKDGGIVRRFVTLESSQEEDMTNEFAENNYGQAAVQESKVAFEAARSRQTAARDSNNNQDDQSPDPWFIPPTKSSNDDDLSEWGEDT